MPLTGKTAVVTGAGRGIGQAYCERLAADGANVVAVDIEDPTQSLVDLPGSGERHGIACDISDADQLADAVKTVIERFGRCDILVNNAGTFPVVDLASVTIEIWRHVQAVNVEPALLFAQAFAPGMEEAGWGRIVNTGSANTLLQNKDLAYMTSKGSVHALTRALANELGDAGITVNAIAPSVIRTGGFVGRDREGVATADDVIAQVTAAQTLKREGIPSDIGNALAFLVSDDASFITGQILHVDGGLTRTGA